jgi:two-component system OmpR family sensor kinase
MRTGRLAPSGLRWRLTAWVAMVMLFAFAVTVFAVYNGTGSQIRRDVDGELRGDMSEFASSLAGASTSAAVAKRVSTYVTSQPFAASSTLLFATLPRSGVLTNQPELFGLRGDDGDTVGEQRAEGRLAGRLLRASDGLSTLLAPDVGDLRLLREKLAFGGVTVQLGVGEPLAIVQRAQNGVVGAFALAGALAFAIALIASLIVGARVSAPLRRMAAIAARVDAGDLHPRMPLDASGRADEMRVLAQAFNHMLDRLTAAFDAQRAFVGDASHELRTPLTVISGQLEVLAGQRSPSASEVARVERMVSAEVSRMSRLADDLLLLTAAEQGEFLRLEEVELPAFIEDLWAGLAATADRRFELGPIPSGVLIADPDRLAQALRNLLANAVSHTRAPRGLIRLDVEDLGGGHLRFELADDGPGIPPAQRARVFDRFYRTDASRNREGGGAGLGLAIVRAIAEAHGGHVSVRESSAGGALFVLEIVGFNAHHSEDTPLERASS